MRNLRNRTGKRAILQLEQAQQHDHDAQGDDADPGEAVPAGDDDCPFCFLSPCVTSHPHHFLGAGQPACDANSGMRKEHYRNYWKVMSNCRGWNDLRYLARKVQAGQGGEWAVVHRREVMPDCILKQVRSLYPNPPNRPYMGHMWE